MKARVTSKGIVWIIAAIMVALCFFPATGYAASEYKISKTKATVLVSKTVKLSVKGAKSGVKWSTSNKKVAKVSSKGKVKGVKPGKATIKAKVGNKVLKCRVTVKAGLTSTQVSVMEESSTKVKLCGTKIKKAVSKDKAIATATIKGVINGISPGKTTITFTGANKKKYKCAVTVNRKYYYVTFDTNGGTQVSIQRIVRGEHAAIPDAPIKDGYIFDHWESDGETFDFSTPIDKDYNLIAFWIEQENGADNLEDATVDMGDLQHLTDNGTIDVSYGESGAVESIDGTFTDIKVTSVDDAIELMTDYVNFLKGFDAEECEVTESEVGDETYYRFLPSVDGIPVLGKQVILSAETGDGTVTGLTSSFDMRVYNVDTYDEIDEEAAVEAAIDYVMEQDSIQRFIQSSLEANGQLDEDELSASVRDQLMVLADLVIIAEGRDEDARLVYKVDISGPAIEVEDEDSGADLDDGSGLEDGSEPVEQGEDESEPDVYLPMISMTVYVNANDQFDDAGSIYSTKRNMDDWWTDTIVSSKTISDIPITKDLNVQKLGSLYRLVDSSRNITVYKTRAVIQVTATGINADIAETSLLTNKVEDRAAYCMAHMETVYDFYKRAVGIDSFDNKGAKIRVYYNYKNDGGGGWTGKVDGFWAASQKSYQGIVIDPSSNGEHALDILGHEFTHAVIEYAIGGLWGKEGDALNEGYADIMGNLVEGKVGDGRWRLGEDSYMEKASMADDFSVNNITGNTEMHTAARVFSHAAYLMMTDSRSAGISNETWAKVYYNSLFRLMNDAEFIDARRAVLYAANRLGFTADQQNAIKDAYDKVGITEPNAIRIVLTWGAEPGDLDSHLVGSQALFGNSFHIYYGDKTYYDGEHKIYVADLDYDDTTSYGPEVTTIHQGFVGTCYFYIHDYSTGSDPESTVMGLSGAKVRVFQGSSKQPTREFTIARGAKGTIWNVCKITVPTLGSVKIDAINTYSDTPLDENGNELEY